MNRRVCALTALAAIAAIAPARASVDFERVEILRAGEEVLALAQDADHFLWVGTTAGLHRFDGRELEAAEVGPELRRRPVVALLAVADALWVALDAPAAVVRVSGGVRTSWGAREGLGPGRVQALAAVDGKIWVATDSGIFEIDRGVKEVTWLRSGDGAAGALAPAHGGGLWVGTTVGVGRWHGGRFEMPWRGGHVRGLMETAPGHLLVTTVMPDRSPGFWALDLTGERARVTRQPSEVRVHAFAPDGTGGAWVGTRRGVVRVDAMGIALQRAQLANHDVSTMVRDHEGNLWLATTLGLVRVPRERPFRVVGTDPSEVVSVHSTTDGGVLLLLDPDSLTHLVGGRTATARGRAPNGLLGFVADDADKVWIGSWQEGLFRYDLRKLEPVALRDWPAGETVRPLLWSPLHGLALAVGSGRLALGTPAAPRWVDLEGLEVKSELVAGVEQPAGRLWLASERHGLVVVEEGRQARRLGRGAGLPSENLTALAAEPNGGLWIGTRDLGLVHHWVGGFTVIGRAQGLPTDSVGGITPDGRGHLWITTAGDGIIRVAEAALLAVVARQRAQVDSTVFTARDGLPTTGSPGRAPPAGAVDDHGRLWLASFRGAIVFPDPNAPSAPPLPTPRIESVRIDGHEIRLRGDRSVEVPGTSTSDRTVEVPGTSTSVTLGQGELQVRYTAVMFEGRERLRFRYRLEGYEASWRDVGDAQEAAYSRLPAGSYRFRVVPYLAGAPDAGKGREAVFAFALAPPFHRSRGFFAGAGALLLLAVALAFWLRLRLLRRRAALLSQERSRIAREIHDSLEQTLYAAKLQLEACGRTSEPRPHLDRGIELVERAIEETRAAVWALRTGVFGRADLATAISVTAGDSLRQSNVRFSLETEGVPYRLSGITEWHIGQIVREAFTNSLKHGRPRRVTVRLHYGTSGVRVDVVDDGVGLTEPSPPGDSSGHYGLQGMRERLRACGGNVTLDSAAGRGTTVSIEVPRSPAS